ncbi:MAG: phenylalanine--tRNA ligase subunit beta, partial [Clostridia bacterium]|nr:phenylalanine--tRNA ligase subunit beta [Clostridia bacterium]
LPQALPLKELPEERRTVGLVAYGEGVDFFTMKGDIEEIFACINCRADLSYDKEDISYMHPGRTAVIKMNGEKVGYFGEINPVLAEKLGAEKRIYAAEIDFGAVEKFVCDKISFKAIAKFPSVERDFALLANKSVTNAQIIDCIKSSNVKNMESVELFDVYTGINLPVGKKSMAYRIKFTALDRTLSVEDVEKYSAKILRNLKEKLDIEIR